MSEKKKAKKATEQAPKSAEKKPPIEWCKALQRYTKGRPPMGQLIPCWQHNAASALHGWAKHEHAANEPIMLTEKAYLDALEVVEVSPLKPCAEALSKYMDQKG